MSVILVVEREGRYIERIRDALGAEGWRTTVVGAQPEALRAAASEEPRLVLVNCELEGAGSLIDSFSRRRGGPGVIALVPESRTDLTNAAQLGADDLLSKPFTDQELRLVVRRGLATGGPQSAAQPPPAAPGEGGGRKLTAQEIFGDVVAEVESEIAVDATPTPEPQPEPSPAAVPRPPQPTTARALAGRSDDDDIERKLEETLSGVLSGHRRRKPPEAAPPKPPAPKPPPPKAKPRSLSSDEVDALLSETLSGLDLGRRRTPPPAEPKPPPPATAEPSATAAPPPAETPSPAAAQPPEPPSFEPPPAAAPPADSPPTTGQAPPDGAWTAEPAAPPPAEPPMPVFEDPLADLDLSEIEELARPRRPPAAAPPPAELAQPSEPSPLPGLGAPPETPQPATPAAASDRPEMRFGQYTLLDRIAVGGMAEVWKARMRGVEGFQKTVAIKKILAHLTDNDEFVSMFIDEAKLAAQLSHPNIIHIYDLGKISDSYYIAMEYVEGRNLRAILNSAREKDRPMPVGLALLVAARLASALDYAHRKRDFDDRELGLVHRDVSPQNVLISFDGDIKLCDFGIAKAVAQASHTQMGALKGKLQYMSPEQAWGRSVDARSDIFSLGSLLFEMLTGRRLFAGDSEISVLEAVRECYVREPRSLNPTVPEEADALVMKALAKEPDDRFDNAGEMQSALEQVLYALKPTPGPAEISSYLTELESAPPAPEPAEPPAEAAAGDAEGRAEIEPPAAEPAAAEPPAAEPPAVSGDEAAAGPEPGSPAAPAATGEAVAAPGVVEVEEGGRRGRGLLIAAIVLAVLAGIAAVYWFSFGPGRPGEPPAAPPAVETPAEPPPPPLAGDPAVDGESLGDDAGQTGEAGGGAAETGDGPTPGGADAGAAPAATGSAAAVPPPPAGEPTAADAATPEALEALADQQLAEREAELRRQLEAEQKRLEQQVEQAQKSAAETPVATPAEPAAEGLPPPGAGAGATESEQPAVAAGRSPTAGDDAGDDDGDDAEDQRQPAAAAAEPAASRAPATPAPAPPATAPEPPAEPAVRRGDLVQPGPGVEPPKLVSIDKPEYPPIARRMRIQGDVVLSLLIDENGRVVETRFVEKIRQNVGINEAAVAAARDARYEPATKNGVRVKMWTTLRLPFRL